MGWIIPGLPDIPMPQGFYLVSCATHYDLWHKDDDTENLHPLDLLWPEWIDQGATSGRYGDALGRLPSLAPFQLLVVQKDANGVEDFVAAADAIPFFHPDAPSPSADDAAVAASLDTVLTSGGWDTILARGVLQAQARGEQHGDPLPTDPLTPDQEADQAVSRRADPPNLLSAIGITVLPEYRALNLAALLIAAFKRLAADAGLRFLCVPLRPTRKADFLAVPFEEYVRWRKDVDPATQDVASGAKLEIGADAFDPWLRRHARLGARPVKIAPSSLRIEGSVMEWFKWTQVDFGAMAEEKVKADLALAENGIVDLELESALAPLRWDVKAKAGTYLEPNLWLFHRV